MSNLALNATLVFVPAAVGGSIFYFGASRVAAERAARRWPRALGTVVSSSISISSGSYRDQEGVDRESTSYEPMITYDYAVGGRSFRSARVKISSASTSNAKVAQGCVDRHPVGGQVQVFYDPKDPASAFLETGTSGGAIFLIVFGGFFLALAILGVVLMILFA